MESSIYNQVCIQVAGNAGQDFPGVAIDVDVIADDRLLDDQGAVSPTAFRRNWARLIQIAIAPIEYWAQ